MSLRSLTLSLLFASLTFLGAFAQVATNVPAGFSASQDLRQEETFVKTGTGSPELPIMLRWSAVPSATAYEVYRAFNHSLRVDTCPVIPANQIAIVTAPTTEYDDNPNPGWYKTQNRGDRTWCYWVTSVVGGVESAPAGPIMGTVGNAGYVFLQFHSKNSANADQCGPALPLDPNISNYSLRLYYTDKNGMHRLNAPQLFDPAPYTLAVVWATPQIAPDGTFVPWRDGDRFTYQFNSIPNGTHIAGYWSPLQGRSRNVYMQEGIHILSDPGQPDDNKICNDNIFDKFYIWQNNLE